MKATELRIGNLVKKGKVEMIANNCIWIHDLPYFFDETEPIPLTEEWLLKFGFEKSYFDDIPYFEKRCLTIDGCFFDVELMDGSKLELRSVHQLQNLYFALTGEELKTLS